MHSRSMRPVDVSFLLVALLLLPIRAAGHDQPPRAQFNVTMTGTLRGGATFTHAGQDAVLKAGETGTLYFFTSAGGEAGGFGPSRPAKPYDYVWHLAITPISLETDLVTFAVDLKRIDRSGAETSDRRRIKLHQNEKHVLDFIRCTPSDSSYANVFLEVQAAPVDDPPLAGTMLTYDLWLVHQLAGGARISRHAAVSGRQGERVTFGFAPVPIQLDLSGSPDAESSYQLQIGGSIAARLRSDGSIDLVVQPTRRGMFPGGGGSAGAGTMAFVAKPEDTSALELPTDYSVTAWKAGGFKVANPKPGVTVSGNSIRVDGKTLFEGSTTTILVKVRSEK